MNLLEPLYNVLGSSNPKVVNRSPTLVQGTLVSMINRLSELGKIEEVEVLNAMMINFTRIMQVMNSGDRDEKVNGLPASAMWTYSDKHEGVISFSELVITINKNMEMIVNELENDEPVARITKEKHQHNK